MQKFCITLGGTKLKPLRRSCAVTVLSLTLAMSVLAGEIEAPGAVAPSNPTAPITATIVQVIVV